MEKYKISFIEKLQLQIEKWLTSKDKIKYEEIYRFLHTIIGTSPTIGLEQLGESPREL